LQIALLPATIPDKPALANLMQFCIYDLSEVDGIDVDDQGRFICTCLDMYWTEAGYYPFLIHADSHLVGFALINRHSRILQAFDGHAMTEFFIMRKYRRLGIGRAAAMQLFDHFPGPWEVASSATNIPAHAFWRSTIDSYTSGRYNEVWLQNEDWRGPVHSFVASAKKV
jgi:predicted acetyltransferase